MVPSPAARYSKKVAGIDEPSARSALAAMQDRLARDPMSALGLGASATAADVRTAFLELTKLYHPVRFGRMALDIQKLSNEVFLALRAAHDALAKSLRRRTGPLPAVPDASPALGSAAHAGPSTQGRTLPPMPAKPRTFSESGERPPVLPRTLTPTRSATTRPLGGPVSRPPSTPSTAPSSAASSARQSGSHPVVAGPRDEAAALELLQRQQWEPARSILHQLLAREPTSKRIRALMCYARGREAQLDRRLDDARVELQDALDLDPDLQLAKTALTELFTRRK
jgi:hypothetical protein